jgi:hypothetical protein
MAIAITFASLLSVAERNIGGQRKSIEGASELLASPLRLALAGNGFYSNGLSGAQ